MSKCKHKKHYCHDMMEMPMESFMGYCPPGLGMSPLSGMMPGYAPAPSHYPPVTAPTELSLPVPAGVNPYQMLCQIYQWTRETNMMVHDIHRTLMEMHHMMMQMHQMMGQPAMPEPMPLPMPCPMPTIPAPTAPVEEIPPVPPAPPTFPGGLG